MNFGLDHHGQRKNNEAYANKDCSNTAIFACAKCGMRYCSKMCQKSDWAFRHKRFCLDTDLHRTKTVFSLHKKRLDDYKSGKSSMGRYYSIGVDMVFWEFQKDRTTLVYPDRRSNSGRVLTVLNEDEDARVQACGLVMRGASVYMVNTALPKISLNNEGVDAGLPVEKAVELIPLNKSLQMT